MEFPTSINWTSPFPFKELLGCIFLIFIKILKSNSVSKLNNVEPDQMPHYAASDLVIHCFRCPIKRMHGFYGLKVNVDKAIKLNYSGIL